jgi:tRNA 2-thiouridine synthesizing protein A
MDTKLDLRGLSCPIPLLETKRALEKATAVTVIVDEPAARENITKFAKSQRYQVESSVSGGDYTLMISNALKKADEAYKIFEKPTWIPG